MWYEKLTGFREESPEQVRENISVNGDLLKSHINGMEYSLETKTSRSGGYVDEHYCCPEGHTLFTHELLHMFFGSNDK